MKKKLLRLLSSALILATIFSTLIFSAYSDDTEDPIVFLMKHDFNDRASVTDKIAGSYEFNGWSGNSEVGLAENEENRADRYMTWKRTTVNASPQLNLFMDADKVSSDTSRSIVVSFRMSFHTFGRFKASLADVNGKWTTLFFINDSGVMSSKADGAGDQFATLTADTWYTVAAVADETAKTSAIYINGEQVGTVKMHNDHTYLKRLQITFEKIDDSGLADAAFDDFYMYEGTKPLDDADLPKPPKPEDPSGDPVPLGGLNFDDLTTETLAETDTWLWNRITAENAQVGLAKMPEEESNQYLTWKRLSADEVQEMHFFMDEDKITSTPRSIVASFKIYIAKAEDLRITLADVNSAFSDVLFINANGKVQTFGDYGPVVATAEEGTWYTVSFVIDELTKTVTFYWNGVNLGKTTCNAKHTCLKRIKIAMIGTNSEAPELWLDDVTFYEAKEPVEKTDDPIVDPGDDDKEIPYELYFNYNWDDNDRVVNDNILAYSKWGADTYFTVVKKDGDNALLFEREESNPRLDFKFGALQVAYKYVISYSFYVVDHNFGYTELTMYDGSIWNYMFQIDADGNLRKLGYEGDFLVTVTSDEWHTIDILINDRTNTYTLLYDGTELLKDTEFNSSNFGNAFRCLYTFTGNKPGSAQVYLDDFRMYAGDKVVEAPKPENPPVVNPPVENPPIGNDPADTDVSTGDSGSEGEGTDTPGTVEAGCQSSLSGNGLIILALLFALAIPLQYKRKKAGAQKKENIARS